MAMAIAPAPTSVYPSSPTIESVVAAPGEIQGPGEYTYPSPAFFRLTQEPAEIPGDAMNPPKITSYRDMVQGTTPLPPSVQGQVSNLDTRQLGVIQERSQRANEVAFSVLANRLETLEAQVDVLEGALNQSALSQGHSSGMEASALPDMSSTSYYPDLTVYPAAYDDASAYGYVGNGVQPQGGSQQPYQWSQWA